MIVQVAGVLTELITDATPLVRLVADELSSQVESFGTIAADVFGAGWGMSGGEQHLLCRV